MRALVLGFFASLCLTAFSEVAVIVHPSNNEQLTENDITRLYLGKAKSFPSGSQAIMINLVSTDPIAEEFSSKVLKKTGGQLKAYWSRLVFTGKGTPPQEVETQTQALELVANNPNFVGYIDASLVDPRVKVVATF
jgi:ABC-type phosphate transport system substrate-binding protein